MYFQVFKARLPDERKLPQDMKRDLGERPEVREESGLVGCVASENERANDCEIIVHDRSQRAYAEMIERNLKRMGLAVDLLFPHDAIPVLTLLANIAARGTLYAITVIITHLYEAKSFLTLQ